MPAMRRMITYLYLYENRIKGKNAGFAKIEIRKDQCRVEVYLRKTGFANITCPIYFCAGSRDDLQGIEIGSIRLSGGNGDFKTVLPERTLQGTSYGMEDVHGILITVDRQRSFVSQWDEMPLIPEKIYIRKEPEAPQETAEASQEPAQEEAEEPQERAETPQENTEEQQERAENAGEEVNEEENGGNILDFPQKNLNAAETEQEPLLYSFPEFQPFSEEPEIRMYRIDLKDLQELPEKYWHLGNNSFVLHGFFNYRFLLFGSMKKFGKDRWYLGVPGIYQNQEKVMAAVFGFPEFKPEKKKEFLMGSFGYWLKPLEIPVEKKPEQRSKQQSNQQHEGAD